MSLFSLMLAVFRFTGSFLRYIKIIHVCWESQLFIFFEKFYNFWLWNCQVCFQNWVSSRFSSHSDWFISYQIEPSFYLQACLGFVLNFASPIQKQTSVVTAINQRNEENYGIIVTLAGRDGRRGHRLGRQEPDTAFIRSRLDCTFAAKPETQ